MYVRNLRGWVFVLTLALAGCGSPAPPTELGEGFEAIQPRTGVTGSAVRLALSEDLRDPAEVSVRVGAETVETLTIPGPRTIVLRLPSCEPGLKSIDVLKGNSMIAQVKAGLLCAESGDELGSKPNKSSGDSKKEGLGKKDPGPGSNWWMLHQDLQHTSNMRLQETMTPLEEKWKRTFPDVLLYTQVIKGEGKLLAGLFGNGEENLVALDPTTGNVQWTFLKTIPPSTVSSTPVAIHGNVYFVEGYGPPAKLHAVDISSGAVVWTVDLPAWTQSSLASAFGFVYVLTRTGSLRCHNASTGALVWEQSVNVGSGQTMSSPAIGFGNVYVGTEDGLRVFDAISGTPKWSGPGPHNGNASPVIVTDVGVGNPAVVAIGSTDTKLRAYQAVTGAALWEFDGNLDLWYTTPATANGKLYLRQNRTIVELDAVTGNQTSVSPDLGARTATAPTINGDQLFVITEDDKLHALSLTDLSVVQTLNINARPGGENGQPSTESGWLYFQAHWSDPYPASSNTIYGYAKE
jgi:outer membrane protein assembly factor BamB